MSGPVGRFLQPTQEFFLIMDKENNMFVMIPLVPGGEEAGKLLADTICKALNEGVVNKADIG